CSKRCAETPGGASNMADLLSSVNTLIDNLSDSRQQPRSAAKVGLWTVDRAVNAATKCAPATKQVKVEARQTQIEQQQQEQPQKRQQVQQPAATSSSNRQAGMAGISDTLSLVSQNASNRRQYIVRRGRKPPPEHTKKKHRLQQGGGSWRAASPDGPNTGGNVDFNYLKDGLGGGHGGSGISGNEPPEGRENCAMVKSLQLLTDRLKRQYEQRRQRRKRVDQQRRGFGGCSWENSMPAARMKAEIRQAQARATCLRNCLRAALGSGGACGPRGPAGCASGDGPATAAVGCRHRGVATEQARDPITDIKCKYERCLLYSRYDVNWPFLHIIAPTPPIFVDPICCEND
uniref:Spaetzle domain-containing protein n=1 Tax=Macrostomum lignano TaxID=282301 RepID=A0A1I8GD65_9PLAT